MALGAGVNTRAPAFRALRAICWPAVTGTPFKLSTPAAGRLSMRTACRVWPASASAKPKSAAASGTLASSSTVRVASVPVGGVLAPTLTVSVALAVPPWPSLMV